MLIACMKSKQQNRLNCKFVLNMQTAKVKLKYNETIQSPMLIVMAPE